MGVFVRIKGNVLTSSIRLDEFTQHIKRSLDRAKTGNRGKKYTSTKVDEVQHINITVDNHILSEYTTTVFNHSPSEDATNVADQTETDDTTNVVN
eukprot:13007385-Ditylum_brightwellii.AAC.1